MKPVVVIVGRPNVGKSTFFNLLAGKSRAIVENKPGVTRDLHFAEATWDERPFIIVDSGGFIDDDQDTLAVKVREQIESALREADVVLFLMDGKTGPAPGDRDIADVLRRADTPVVYAANKVDNDKLGDGVYEFTSLGIDECHPVSSMNRRGFGALMDAIVERFPARSAEEGKEPAEGGAPRVAIIGRPNAGKSSLVNALCGEGRVIVSDEPGTTRDAIDVPFRYKDSEYVLVDTAGIRRQAKVKVRVETYAVVRALRAVERADVAVIVLDAGREIAAQDERISGYAHDDGCGVVIAVNKWDLKSRGGAKAMREFEKEVRYRFGYLSYAPVVFTSALKGKGLDKLMDAVSRVAKNRRRRVGTGPLNEWLEKVLVEHSPPVHMGRRLKIYYITQVRAAPPTFVGFANYPEAIHFSYRRYLANRLRELADFEGTPIRLKFKKRGKKG